jgi:hypothetical protein
MRKRSGYASSLDEVTKLSAAALDEQIAHAKWRIGAMSNAGLRNAATKRLAMLERVKAERRLLQKS